MQVRIEQNNQRLLKLIRQKHNDRKSSDAKLINILLGVAMYQLLPEVKAKDDQTILGNIVEDVMKKPTLIIKEMGKMP